MMAPNTTDETTPQSLADETEKAKMLLRPESQPAHTISAFLAGNDTITSGAMVALAEQGAAVGSGDLSQVEGMLLGQAVALQAMFTKLAGRAAANMGEHMGAMETYARLAMKAQAQSRATLEALAKMKQPREQTIRHVHVGPNGQAVFIENLNGGFGNGKIGNQPHAFGPALLGQDQEKNGMPVPSHAEWPMSHARREVSGRAEGEPKCVEARGTLDGDNDAAKSVEGA